MSCTSFSSTEVTSLAMTASTSSPSCASATASTASVTLSNRGSSSSNSTAPQPHFSSTTLSVSQTLQVPPTSSNRTALLSCSRSRASSRTPPLPQQAQPVPPTAAAQAAAAPCLLPLSCTSSLSVAALPHSRSSSVSVAHSRLSSLAISSHCASTAAPPAAAIAFLPRPRPLIPCSSREGCTRQLLNLV